LEQFEYYQLVVQTAVTLRRHFPEFESKLSALTDNRKRRQYEVRELVMAVILMFVFKRGSRNHADNTASKFYFRKNILRIFKVELPDLDTSNRLLKTLPPEELEAIKQHMVSVLVQRKVLHKFRLLGFYFNVAIDGTGLHSFDYEPYPGCPYKTYKSGKVWTVYVLEAKIVCPNGFSLSIATEWVRNPQDKAFDKQDCELKAFSRLADKIKKLYPRLPICITADGLYSNKTFLNKCEQHDWQHITTLKDDSLKSVWEEAHFMERVGNCLKVEKTKVRASEFVTEKYTIFHDIEYQKHKLNILEVNREISSLKKLQNKETERFVHLSSFKPNQKNCSEISQHGCLRWKIENEGFNEQKNGGYNLKHKFARKSFNATSNYYQCLQIAHIINQLAYKVKEMSEFIQANDTLKSNMEVVIAILFTIDLETISQIDDILNRNRQFRY